MRSEKWWGVVRQALGRPVASIPLRSSGRMVFRLYKVWLPVLYPFGIGFVLVCTIPKGAKFAGPLCTPGWAPQSSALALVLVLVLTLKPTTGTAVHECVCVCLPHAPPGQNPYPAPVSLALGETAEASNDTAFRTGD